jgi:murein DD-endopeptidase MepM/ murein hydrolase activator NlpD
MGVLSLTDRISDVKVLMVRGQGLAKQHPRALAITVLSLLGGFGVTAFGIAPMAPNAADLPRKLITEVVEPAQLDEQLAQLSEHSLALVRNDLTRSSDTADSLLRRLGAFDPQAAKFLRSDSVAKLVLQGRAGKMVQVTADSSGRVQSMVVRFAALAAEQQSTHFTRLNITRDGEGFKSQLQTAALMAQTQLGSGTVRSSLFAATDDARIPDAVASQMADMFSGDIDFHRDLRRGDRFSLVYETLTADGEPIRWEGASARLVAAEFVNNGHAYSAIWFKDPVSGKGSFYGFDGQSKRRAFLASPLEFSRVTSNFSMRFHPILQTWRQHLGTDFGAPTGTAVRCVGDGIVEFAGWQNGYGNVVHVRHSNDRTTVYAHMSRLDVRKGQRVEQGQRIGAVGATGWATGPHLHFEFRLHGQQKDPRIIARASESVNLPASARNQFLQSVASVKAQLSVASSFAMASNAE